MPTLDVWRGMDAARAMKMYHWLFLAQPAPVPENLIAPAPLDWLDHTLASWTADKSLHCFDARADGHYRASFSDPSRIHAACEDYRAGATLDRRSRRRRPRRRPQDPAAAAGLVGQSRLSGAGREPPRRLAAMGEDVARADRRSNAGISRPRKAPEETLAALLAFL